MIPDSDPVFDDLIIFENKVFLDDVLGPFADLQITIR